MLYIVKMQVAVEADSPKQAHDLAETPIADCIPQKVKGQRIVAAEVLKIKKVNV